MSMGWGARWARTHTHTHAHTQLHKPLQALLPWPFHIVFPSLGPGTDFPTFNSQLSTHCVTLGLVPNLSVLRIAHLSLGRVVLMPHGRGENEMR